MSAVFGGHRPPLQLDASFAEVFISFILTDREVAVGRYYQPKICQRDNPQKKLKKTLQIFAEYFNVLQSSPQSVVKTCKIIVIT